MLKPKYIRWRHWWLWILLPRERKQALDDLMGTLTLLRPLLRNPDIVEKIRARESCSWSLCQKDATDTLEALERYRDATN